MPGGMQQFLLYVARCGLLGDEVLTQTNLTVNSPADLILILPWFALHASFLAIISGEAA